MIHVTQWCAGHMIRVTQWCAGHMIRVTQWCAGHMICITQWCAGHMIRVTQWCASHMIHVTKWCAGHVTQWCAGHMIRVTQWCAGHVTQWCAGNTTATPQSPDAHITKLTGLALPGLLHLHPLRKPHSFPKCKAVLQVSSHLILIVLNRLHPNGLHTALVYVVNQHWAHQRQVQACYEQTYRLCKPAKRSPPFIPEQQTAQSTIQNMVHRTGRQGHIEVQIKVT